MIRKIACCLMPFVFFILVVSSCKKDTTTTREDYIGTWYCSETKSSTNTTINYTITINADPSNDSRIIIQNFNYFGNDFSAYADVTESSITIPKQVVCSNDVSGSGSLDNNTTISLSYSVNDNADLEQYTARLTKK